VHNQPRYSIQNILIDNNNWERYKLLHKGELREEQIKEIDAMLLCNDPKKGFWVYYCKNCNEYSIRHLSCNSKACCRCGRRHLKMWVKKTVERMLDVEHSHLIFTLPKDISLLLKENWECITELTKSAFQVLEETMCKSAKQEVTPGMICAIHTYGDEINWNVHFHTIITEGGETKNKWFKSVYYLPYEIMRKKWRDYSLSVIKKYTEMTINNQNTIVFAEHQYKNGFNIKRIKSKIPKKELVGYIARYIRHPPISNRRIVDYDEDKVTILCKLKETKIKYQIKFTVDSFIACLIQHISPKHFKLIHYFGLYSRIKYNPVVKKDKQETIMNYFGVKHTIKCQKCKRTLEPIGFFSPFYPEKPPPKEVFGNSLGDWC
jgi:hypothetical protein